MNKLHDVTCIRHVQYPYYCIIKHLMRTKIVSYSHQVTLIAMVEFGRAPIKMYAREVTYT